MINAVKKGVYKATSQYAAGKISKAFLNRRVKSYQGVGRRLNSSGGNVHAISVSNATVDINLRKDVSSGLKGLQGWMALNLTDSLRDTINHLMFSTLYDQYRVLSYTVSYTPYFANPQPME